MRPFVLRYAQTLKRPLSFSIFQANPVLVGAGIADVKRPNIPFFAMSSSSRIAAVYVGGVAGTLVRAGVAEGIGSPWATLLVNVVGALPERRPLLGTGFCGGLTTFSTLQLEALEMSTGAAVAYLAASAVLGWLAVAAGKRLAR